MRIKMKSVISALLASVMLIGTIPAVTYAAQVNEYTDPADNWLKANGRTNELDMNATTTYETGYCTVCQRDTLGLCRGSLYRRNGRERENGRTPAFGGLHRQRGQRAGKRL